MSRDNLERRRSKRYDVPWSVVVEDTLLNRTHNISMRGACIETGGFTIGSEITVTFLHDDRAIGQAQAWVCWVAPEKAQAGLNFRYMNQSLVGALADLVFDRELGDIDYAPTPKRTIATAPSGEQL